jgi:type IV secretory pathway VirB3-like protein
MHTTADERALWMVVLGIGLVVCIVVIVLLWLLISIVYDIDERVAYLWTVTKRTAINTTGLYQFAGTASILRALREELLRHEKLLAEATGEKVPS